MVSAAERLFQLVDSVGYSTVESGRLPLEMGDIRRGCAGL